MTIQAFVDESGGKGQSPVFVFSALMATAEEWIQFSDQWQSILDESPQIHYFKMNEATSLSGEFHRFTPGERDEKLKRLCEPMKGLLELFCVEDLSYLSLVEKEEEVSLFTEPYFIAFQTVIMAVALQLFDLGFREPFEMFFDENVIFGERSRHWYPVVKSLLDDDARAIMPVEPYFRSDREYLPLQAADMTAWLRRRWNADKTIGGFQWMEAELRHRLMPSPFSQLFDNERWTEIWKQAHSPDALKRARKSLQIYREIYGREATRKKKGKA